jgi:hypothetical protein
MRTRTRLINFLLFAAAVAAFFSPAAHAILDPVNSEWHSTARALGMGNAAIASGDDAATAMFYNPAALASNRKVQVEFFSPQFEFSTSNLTVAKGAGDQSKLISLEKTVPLLDKSRGKPAQLGFSIYPNFSARNLAFGILLSLEGGSAIDKDRKLFIRSQYLVIPTMGVTFGLMSGLIKLGIAGRAIQITTNNKSTSTLTGQGYLKDAQEGFGIGLDAGVIVTLPVATLPAFGLVVRNIGDTNLGKDAIESIAIGAVRDAGAAPMTADAGFTIEPKLAQRTVLRLSGDYRDLTHESKASSMRKINLGLELGLNRRLYFRGGFGQGYWTAGFGLSGKSASLDLATYGEEIHPTKFHYIEDRRVAIRYGGRF